MGQRVVTSLNHLDFKKNKKIKIIIMQITKGDKSTRKGDHHFLGSQRKEHTWGGTKKKNRE